ncbi:hypothetical protein BH20ACT16_BH20ACT16_06860 [soil metagenome]
MLRLVRLKPELIDWPVLDAYDDRVVFQTREWQDFVSRTQDSELVVASLMEGDEIVGYFTGQIVRRSACASSAARFPAGRHRRWASTSTRA